MRIVQQLLAAAVLVSILLTAGIYIYVESTLPDYEAWGYALDSSSPYPL